jgi:hypothetical protein
MTEVVFYYLMEPDAISTTGRRFDGCPSHRAVASRVDLAYTFQQQLSVDCWPLSA